MTANVVTGEAVALDVRLAHWPSRLVAFVIDITVQFFALVAVNLALSRMISDADTDLQLAATLTALLLVVLGYPIALETLWGGRTLGKAALGLRVVRDDGAPERFRHAVARAILMPLEFWGPALLSSIISRRAKRLGDLLAGTVVVQTRVPGAHTSLPVAMPPPLAMWASTLDLSRLSDDLALSVRQFLSRQHELHPAAREAMGQQLVAAVQIAVTPAPPPGTPGWAYLSAVLAERRRREEWRLRAPSAMAPPAYGQPATYPQPPAVATPPAYQQPPQPVQVELRKQREHDTPPSAPPTPFAPPS